MTVESVTSDWLLTPNQPPEQHGAVTLDLTSGCIDAIHHLPTSHEGGGTFFVTPGLINAHTHLELVGDTPLPLATSDTIADWILKVVSQSKVATGMDKLTACNQSILASVRAGVTCVNDISSSGASLDALSLVGMRGVVSLEFFHPHHELQLAYLDGVIERFNTLSAQFSSHPLMAVGISPHSPYNVTAEAWQYVTSHMEPALVHTHVGESQEEVLWFAQGESALDTVHERLLGQTFGPIQTGITSLDSVADLMDPTWVVAHGTFLNGNDRARLQQCGVGLVHCPRSNQHLTQATLATSVLTEEELNIGLGTDSLLSSPSLDLREEACVAQQHHGLSAEALFALMTHGAAQAMHMEDTIGAIAPGMAGDLVLWHTPITSVGDPYEVWLSPETRPVLVVINGRVVMECLPEESLMS